MNHVQIKPMFDVNQTIEDLTKTIEHLRQARWIQGRNFDRAGGCCTWGAIMHVTHDSRDLNGSLERSANVGRAFYRAVNEDIVSYNDAEGRTKDQVVRTLETVLAELKADPSILTAKKEDKP